MILTINNRGILIIRCHCLHKCLVQNVYINHDLRMYKHNFTEVTQTKLNQSFIQVDINVKYFSEPSITYSIRVGILKRRF